MLDIVWRPLSGPRGCLRFLEAVQSSLFHGLPNVAPYFIKQQGHSPIHYRGSLHRVPTQGDAIPLPLARSVGELRVMGLPPAKAGGLWQDRKSRRWKSRGSLSHL